MQPIYFSSTDIGAPTITNTVGCLLQVLQACLVDGYNQRTVTSITVIDGVATASSTSHGYEAHPNKPVTLSGSGVQQLNGSFVITATSVDQFTFSTTAPNGTYTDTISAVRTTPGWVRTFTGTNKAVYKSGSAYGCGHSLWVLDNSESYATVSAYESMSDVDTGTNKYPSATPIYWVKTDTTNGNRVWFIVADEFGFYLRISYHTSYPTQGPVYYFGDFLPKIDGSTHHSYISGNPNTSNGSGNWGFSCSISNQISESISNLTTGSTSGYVARSSNNTKSVKCLTHGLWPGPSSQQMVASGAFNYSWGYSSSSEVPTATPNTKKTVCRVGILTQQDSYTGTLPGVLHYTTLTPSSTEKISYFSGKQYLEFCSMVSLNNATQGMFLISLDDWRV